MQHLAQINIGKILGPMDSDLMADFRNNLEPINALAEKSAGFVWRLKDETDNATSIKVFDDDMLIVNMSVWKDLASLFEFVYKTDHVNYFKRRREWFEKMTEFHMAMWYVPQDHIPTVHEAIARLEHLRKHGETPYSFSFRSKFTVEEAMNYNGNLTI